MLAMIHASPRSFLTLQTWMCAPVCGAGDLCGVIPQTDCGLAAGECLSGVLCLALMPRAVCLFVHCSPACAALGGCRLASRDQLRRQLQTGVYHA